MFFKTTVAIAVGLAGLAVPYFLRKQRKEREQEEKEKELSEEIKTQAFVIKELSARNQDLQAGLNTLQDQLENKRMQSNFISRECLTLDGKLRCKNEELKGLEVEYYKLQDTLQRKEEEIAFITGAYNELAQEFAKLQNRHARLLSSTKK